jgi:hypothetical protein
MPLEEIELSSFKDRKIEQLESDIKLRLQLANEIISTAEKKLKVISNNIDNFLTELCLKLDLYISNIVFIGTSSLFLKVIGKEELSIFEQIIRYNKYVDVPDNLILGDISSSELTNYSISRSDSNLNNLITKIDYFVKKYSHHFGTELQSLLFELKDAFNKITRLAKKAQQEIQEVNLIQEELREFDSKYSRHSPKIIFNHAKLETKEGSKYGVF